MNGTSGFALTAAHCVQLDTPQYVVQGNDYNASSAIVYPVVSYKAHPSYNQQVYDFGMVKFTGASGSTPIIPAMQASEDTLALGSVVNIIGYGITQNNNQNQSSSSNCTMGCGGAGQAQMSGQSSNTEQSASSTANATQNAINANVPVSIGGSLVGGSGSESGGIYSADSIGSVTIGHELVGGGITGTMPSLDWSGAIESNHIGAVFIGGSIVAGERLLLELTFSSVIHREASSASIVVTSGRAARSCTSDCPAWAKMTFATQNER